MAHDNLRNDPAPLLLALVWVPGGILVGFLSSGLDPNTVIKHSRFSKCVECPMRCGGVECERVSNTLLIFKELAKWRSRQVNNYY